MSYKVNFDEPNSVLNPVQGANQKFRYVVVGIDNNNSHAGLEYIILGINPDIKANQIKNISVYINGESKKVHFNTGNSNVSLVTLDPNTGISGLKFDFPLEEAGGYMEISFELTVVSEIGPMQVALFGGNSIINVLTINGPSKTDSNGSDGDSGDGDDDDGDDDDDEDEYYEFECCERCTCKVFDVSVPVTIRPFATPLMPEVKCLDRVWTHDGIEPCHRQNHSFDFTIKQKVAVKIPVKFGARTSFHKTCVEEDRNEEFECEEL